MHRIGDMSSPIIGWRQDKRDDKKTKAWITSAFRIGTHYMENGTDADADAVWNAFSNIPNTITDPYNIRNLPNVVEIEEEKKDQVDIPNMPSDQFWAIIDDIKWRDRDELVMLQIHINRVISRIEADQMLKHVERLSIVLEDRYNIDKDSDEYAELRLISNHERFEFWSHVIGKGEQFYLLCLEYPFTPLYMVSTYQSLRGMLTNTVIEINS